MRHEDTACYNPLEETDKAIHYRAMQEAIEQFENDEEAFNEWCDEKGIITRSSEVHGQYMSDMEDRINELADKLDRKNADRYAFEDYDA